MTAIRIEGREIGSSAPCFLVAEIGMNHNGNMDLAKKTIDAAGKVSADAVKFQNYRTEDFISDKSLTYEYVSQGETIVESQFDMFKRCELTKEDLHELKAYSDRRGIIFHSTPTSESGVRDLIEVGAPILKNGSDYLTHLPLIRTMGQTGLPTVLSTGMATLAENDDAVRAYRETGNDQLILLHCVSSYPTPPEDVHLRKIPALRSAFGCPVGFSDHTDGIVAAVGAVVLGACWIEKHFTLDKTLPGPDHLFSADPTEFEAMVKAVRTAEKSLGDSSIAPSPSERLGRRDFRLSCVAAKDLSAGHRLTEPDILLRRPGTGFAPKAQKWLVGRQLARTVAAGHLFEMRDLV